MTRYCTGCRVIFQTIGDSAADPHLNARKKRAAGPGSCRLRWARRGANEALVCALSIEGMFVFDSLTIRRLSVWLRFGLALLPAD